MTTRTDSASVALMPAEKRVVGIIALVALMRMLGLFSLLPVLSVYAKSLDGATSLKIGLAVGAYGLTQAALQIPFAALSDRIGRLPVILAGLALFAAGSAVAALGESIDVVILGRLMQGAGAISGTLSALIADATRSEVRTRSMAIFGIAIGASFFVAIPVGPVIAAHLGGAALFWMGVLLAAASAVLLLGLPHGIPRPAHPGGWDLRPAFRLPLLRLDLYVFLLHTIMTATFVALPFLVLHELGMPMSTFWKLILGAVAVSLLGAVPLIRGDERQGKAQTMRIGVALLLAGQLALAFSAGSLVMAFGGLVAYFAGFTFLEAALPARLSLLADEGRRGASLGVFSSAQFLGAFAGGLLGGRFLAGGDPGDVFLACAMLAALWLLAGALFRGAK